MQWRTNISGESIFQIDKKICSVEELSVDFNLVCPVSGGLRVVFTDCSVESWCYQDREGTGDMCETFLPANLVINSQVVPLHFTMAQARLSQVNWNENISLLVPLVAGSCWDPRTDGYSINSVALIKCGISDVLDLFKINRNPKQHIRKRKINGRYTVDKTNNSFATDQFLILRAI